MENPSPYPLLVMKFGGASVKNAEAVRNVCRIILQHQQAGRGLAVVISAMDKTTNHLEILAQLARDCKEAEAWAQWEKIRNFHDGIIRELFVKGLEGVESTVARFYTEVERIIRGIILLGEFPPRTYDRIVAYGELLSTSIVAQYLQQEDLALTWLDARDLIKTDASHTHAEVIWSLTQKNLRTQMAPLLAAGQVVLIQGFIASSIEGKVTTLGREGSDFTAAIIAHCLEAERVIVWKDVKGILNGDPRIWEDTVKIDQMSYEEAVEMTFYGASVIHPKTIQPLYKYKIPMQVKCFADTSETGTLISGGAPRQIPESICSRIIKPNQALVRVKPRDFSFMDEVLMNRVFAQLSRSGIRLNLVQSSAISLTLCVDNDPHAIGELESHLVDQFFVKWEEGLVLKTFMNYGETEWSQIKEAVLVQQEGGRLYWVGKA